MSLDFGLKGVHVLVTGASGGIGFETVKTFLALGARVTAHYNSNKGELDGFKQVVAIKADVRNEQEVEQMFDDAAKRQNDPVSCLVINHGIFPVHDAQIADMDLTQWTNTLAVNLTGSFLLSKAYLRALRSASTATKDTASVVIIGSTSGKFGEAGHGDYSATKAALMYGFVPTLKNEIVAIAPKARVNSVNPGWVATPMAKSIMQDERLMERALASTPLQKVAQPEDVARQVAVLASPTLSGHVSGVSLMVDGGMEGRLLFPPRIQ